MNLVDRRRNGQLPATIFCQVRLYPGSLGLWGGDIRFDLLGLLKRSGLGRSRLIYHHGGGAFLAGGLRGGASFCRVGNIGWEESGGGGGVLGVHCILLLVIPLLLSNPPSGCLCQATTPSLGGLTLHWLLLLLWGTAPLSSIRQWEGGACLGEQCPHLLDLW